MPIQLTWLLDNKGEEAGVSDIRSAIDSIGDRHITVDRKEVRFGTEELTLSLNAAPALGYGSVEFVKAIRSDLYPGKWSDWTELRCERYFAKVGGLLLNDDYFLLPAADVRRRLTTLISDLGNLFLRPTRADKPFTGMVATINELETVDLQLGKVEPYDLVVVAAAKVIEAEYRTIAVRGKGIVAACKYSQNSESSLQGEVPSDVFRLADSVVNMIGYDFPDPMYVVDVAQSSGEFRLLEINGFSYAIFYTCDLEAIVRAAHEEAVHEWEEIQP